MNIFYKQLERENYRLFKNLPISRKTSISSIFTIHSELLYNLSYHRTITRDIVMAFRDDIEHVLWVNCLTKFAVR